MVLVDVAVNFVSPCARRQKAGVFAVMAGMPLFLNLKKRLEGLKLDGATDRYVPQTSFMGLIGTGDGGCFASKGRMALEGKCLWELKDWVDWRWMHVYSEVSGERGARSKDKEAPFLLETLRPKKQNLE